MSSIGKESVQNAKETRTRPKDGGDGNFKPQQQWKDKNELTISVSSIKQMIVVANPAASVFRYIPKSPRKDGESPLSECASVKSTTKIDIKLEEAS